MAVNDYRPRSSDFVQHWVNSLPPLRESGLTQSTPLSSPSTSNSDSHNSLSSSYERNRDESCTFSTDASDVRHFSAPNPPITIDSKERERLDSVDRQNQLQRSATCTVDKKPLQRKSSRLSWMHSNYSSFNSETSSIDLLLEERKTNPEQVLMNLGFGVTDHSIASRLPSRFLAGETGANGIDMQNFIKYHPELSRYTNTETALAMGELQRRLPYYYRQVGTTEEHTSLHKKFSSSSLELRSDQACVPLTVHKSEDGTMFASILTKSNTEQLARQGFYSEHSSQEPRPKLSSASSISTHDCTIDSVDTPSPIILNNSPSSDSDSQRNPFISTQSSLSDSVFSSTESYTMDQRLRAKLEAIHEKSLNEISDEDLEEGISFVSRRRSDSDLVKEPYVICEDAPTRDVSIHRKRKAFARTKSRSFDEEGLTQMLRDKLESCNVENSLPSCIKAPVIVMTDTSQEDFSEPVVPKQADGLLQVMFAPESFDSIDSDTGTLVPSPYASPYQGMSPNTSRTGSLSLLPAMESFELEEVQSCADSNVPQSSTTRRRARLQRSVSERSDSDSSGIADIDCKSSHDQSDQPAANTSSTYLELPSACNKSISSSSQTLNSLSSVQTTITTKTVEPVLPQRPRRSSDSDVSDAKYYSMSSVPSSAGAFVKTSVYSVQLPKQDLSTQTDEFRCPCCGTSMDKYNSNFKSISEWQINNPTYSRSSSVDHRPSSPVTDGVSPGLDAAFSPGGTESQQDGHPKFFILNNEGETDESVRSSVGYSSDDLNMSASSLDHDRRVEEICTEMSRDLRVLKDLIAKYNIDSFTPNSPCSHKEVGVKQEILSSVHLVKSVLSPDTHATRTSQDQSTQSDCSLSSHEESSTRSSQLTLDSKLLPTHPQRSASPTHPQPSASPTHPQPSVSAPSNLDSLPEQHQMSSLQCPSPSPHQSSTFIPISIGCDSCSARAPINKSASPIAGRSLSAHNCCFGQCSCSDDSLVVPPSINCHRSGSVSSTPPSLATPNSYAHSSVSSSVSRLSDQLKLANNKCRYEKKMAELEFQKCQLSLQMKDEEIEYWKSLAEQSGLD